MGMPISIHVRGQDVDSPEVAAGVQGAFALITEADRLFSTFRQDSEVSRIRRGELDPALADPLVRQVITACRRAGDLTLGAFTDRLPDRDGVLRFDPTGLVKGWAADRASRCLAALPGTSFCLNAGGDVVVGTGPGAGAAAARATARAMAAAGLAGGVAGRPEPVWRVGIENPRDRSQILEVVELADGAVATSGAAARGAHLYDPATGTFPERPGSVSVVGPSLLWADVWATALYVGPASLSDRFCEVAPGYRVIRL
jgi:FAD:protein FMN transferase